MLGVLIAAWLQTFGMAELMFWFTATLSSFYEQFHDAELQGFLLSPLLTPSMELFWFFCSVVRQ